MLYFPVQGPNLYPPKGFIGPLFPGGVMAHGVLPSTGPHKGSHQLPAIPANPLNFVTPSVRLCLGSEQ